MNDSAEAQALTGTLLSTIRLQRHLGARIVICTQEPTISPTLLDLCSVTIVHRFTSPEWMRSLKAHLAGASLDMMDQADESNEEPNPMTGLISSEKGNTAAMIFKTIVGLEVGQALLFSPSAMVDVGTANGDTTKYTRLGTRFLKVRVRSRLTTDGVLAV